MAIILTGIVWIGFLLFFTYVRWYTLMQSLASKLSIFASVATWLGVFRIFGSKWLDLIMETTAWHTWKDLSLRSPHPCQSPNLMTCAKCEGAKERFHHSAFSGSWGNESEVSHAHTCTHMYTHRGTARMRIETDLLVREIRQVNVWSTWSKA